MGDSDDWADAISAIANTQNKQAFARLYEDCTPRLRAWLIKTGALADEADEIAQETMIKVWQKSKQFDRTRASGSAWIFAIARNQRIDLVRKKNVRGRTQDNYALEYPAHIDEPTQPDQHLAAGDTQAHIRNGMHTLTTDQQAVINLAFFEGLSHRQIAAQLDLPVGTVKSRIRLAFARLKSELADVVL
ncbi:MAG: sigma-70 family RNA polymerase sigma factor [Alphaproteobacteria bacterium]